MALLRLTLFRLRWAAWALFKLHPIAGAAEGDDDEKDKADAEKKSDDADKDAEKDKAADADKDDPEADAEKVDKDDDWQTKARKHERRAKAEERKRKKAEADAEKMREATQTEAEKALEQAKKEAAEAAKSETETAYRAKIRKSEIRAAAAKSFENPDLAVRLVEIDDEDLFDDEGDVDRKALKSALDELLEENPGLKAGAANGRATGDDDAGKGGDGAKDLEEMGIDDHLEAVRKK